MWPLWLWILFEANNICIYLYVFALKHFGWLAREEEMAELERSHISNQWLNK